jgi:uncharacterized protein YceK
MKLLIIFLLATMMILGGCSSTSQETASGEQNVPVATVSEQWKATIKGTTVGAFICVDGYDSYYEENAEVVFEVAGGMNDALENGNGKQNFKGTFSNKETGIEANGIGCAPPPSVFTNEVKGADVSVSIIPNQITIKGTQPLMKALFRYGVSDDDSLEADQIFLNIASMEDTRITGTWGAWSYAHQSRSGITASGEFIAEKLG